MKLKVLFILLAGLCLFVACSNTTDNGGLDIDDGNDNPDGDSGYDGSSIWIDHSDRLLSSLSDSELDKAKQLLHIAYNHTSHGSQLITGMDSLEEFPSFFDLYSWGSSDNSSSLHLLDGGIPGIADLSQGDRIDENGVTPWVTHTRAFLDDPDNEDINVIVWSWCSINGHVAKRYVDNLEILVAEYPHIQFVFMTGHSEGQGEDLTEDSVHYNNELIRQHCIDNNRILFDFADIESYDPDGDYFWDLDMADNLDYDGGNWAVEWIAENPNDQLTQLTTGNGVDGYDGCQGTAHSDSPQEANLNGILKGIAAWNLWVALAENL
ncbi:MAG: hypothetical protein PF447_05845 [Spirochaetaceae bacterium]|jgi:hypothetical protein|nr:hypothetical protein [Spirochaetaceae bacterium]